MALEACLQDFLVEKNPDKEKYINGFFGFDGYGILRTFICHPFHYVTTLIQIGYEPLPAIMESGVAVYYPNKLLYLKYIADIHGFKGLYRGLTAHLMYRTIRVIVIYGIGKTHYFRETEDCRFNFRNENRGRDVSELDKIICHLENTIAHMVAVLVGITVSHPFYIVMVRRMGSVVGGETEYTGILSSLKDVYRASGLAGFFTGLTHRLYGGAVRVFIPAICIYALCFVFDFQSVVRMSRFAKCVGNWIGLCFSNSITRRSRVCSNTMIVNNSGLAIGTAPYAPIFGSVFSCYSHLRKLNLLSRGSTIFFRPYTGQPLGLGISAKNQLLAGSDNAVKQD